MASSFLANKFVPEGLTYDDVLLVPAYSEVLPREVSIASSFTKNIKINSPIVSAAMDTVTEYQMAITMAQEGGIGVLHKNMTIEEQARLKGLQSYHFRYALLYARDELALQ